MVSGAYIYNYIYCDQRHITYFLHHRGIYLGYTISTFHIAWCVLRNSGGSVEDTIAESVVMLFAGLAVHLQLKFLAFPRSKSLGYVVTAIPARPRVQPPHLPFCPLHHLTQSYLILSVTLLADLVIAALISAPRLSNMTYRRINWKKRGLNRVKLKPMESYRIETMLLHTGDFDCIYISQIKLHLKFQSDQLQTPLHSK